MRSDPDEIKAHQAEFDAARSSLSAYPGGYEGRGIVICAGGARLFTCAWVCIGLLRRKLDCTLPIEVWYLGPEEMSPPMRALLASFGDVTVIDALEVATRHPARRLGGWELKSYAIKHSRFREVLLLDADNCATVDPAFLFETEPYRRTGAILWPDIDRLTADNPVWEIFRVAFRSEPAHETGQILVDKARCWDALTLAVHINAHSEYYYRFMHGDKDSFHLAWLSLDRAYAIPPFLPKIIGAPNILCQRDFNGRVILQHRTGAKWALYGENKTFDGVENQDFCFALVEELRSKWDGRVLRLPPATAETLAAERELIETRRFTYRLLGKKEWTLELLPDNMIGAGRSGEETNWYVGLRDGAVTLTFSGSGIETSTLTRNAAGHWAGIYSIKERGPVELIAQCPASGIGTGRRSAPPGLLDDLLAAYAGTDRGEAAAAEFAAAIGFLIRAYPDLRPLLAERMARDASIPSGVRNVLMRPTSSEGAARTEMGHRHGLHGLAKN